jgi:hypothetical protein
MKPQSEEEVVVEIQIGQGTHNRTSTVWLNSYNSTEEPATDGKITP